MDIQCFFFCFLGFIQYFPTPAIEQSKVYLPMLGTVTIAERHQQVVDFPFNSGIIGSARVFNNGDVPGSLDGGADLVELVGEVRPGRLGRGQEGLRGAHAPGEGRHGGSEGVDGGLEVGAGGGGALDRVGAGHRAQGRHAEEEAKL